MAVIISNKGQFRANEMALGPNNLRLADPNTPGTVATDTLTVDTSALGPTAVVNGITYQGKDGTAVQISFSRPTYPEGGRDDYDVQAKFIDTPAETTEALRKAIQEIVELHEKDPEITVTYTGDPTDTLVVVHVGAGTLSKLIIDGAEAGTNVRA